MRKAVSASSPRSGRRDSLSRDLSPSRKRRGSIPECTTVTRAGSSPWRISTRRTASDTAMTRSTRKPYLRRPRSRPRRGNDSRRAATRSGLFRQGSVASTASVTACAVWACWRSTPSSRRNPASRPADLLPRLQTVRLHLGRDAGRVLQDAHLPETGVLEVHRERPEHRQHQTVQPLEASETDDVHLEEARQRTPEDLEGPRPPALLEELCR